MITYIYRYRYAKLWLSDVEQQVGEIEYITRKEQKKHTIITTTVNYVMTRDKRKSIIQI